jgi:diaminopimelate epimerase
MKETSFFKMTGSGNDFVMLDGRGSPAERWTGAMVTALCDRRNGVGADGLVVLTPAGGNSVRMTFWNSDGSRAAMCGNAALCSARLSVSLGLVPPGQLCLLTDAGTVEARADGQGESAEIRMPDFDLPAEVPGLGPGHGEIWVAAATVGVPHLVVRVPDIEAVDVLGRGRQLRFDPRLGPAGANVNFVAPADRPGPPWLIRTYERGVEGETLACGTGTVAAAVALADRGEATLPIRFRARGGPELLVRARVEGRRAADAWLGGQGRLLFKGVWEGS